METRLPTNSLEVRRLGRVPYAEALALQEDLRERLARGEIGETVLLLEHPDVVTFGRGAKNSSALASDTELRRLGYDVFRVGRGGDATFHGPGQLVGYPILDLRRHGADVHRYLRDLEAVLITALADFGIESRRRDGFAGVWLDERRKIASIGVGVRGWRTVHGFALNVDCALERFAAIVPCGLSGVEMVSMSSVLGRAVSLERVTASVELELRKRFQ
ncbi:MAG: lipoyl(octanoyl) transferase LipB [Myxococcota bacterium]